jgi:two-component system, NarL family, response regulator DegU
VSTKVLAESTEAVASSSRRSRIVLADDEPLARDMLKQVISQHPDLEMVGEAQGGQLALDLCRRLRPDVLLVKARMPQMDGIEATRRIKREFPGIGVLVLTELENPDYLVEALKAGAAGYILKQCSSPQQIVEAVRGVMRGEYPLDQEMTMRLLRRLGDEPPSEEA